MPVPQIDVLCGGFPCQDLSVAGKGAGIDGARSGLWSEYARLIGELRPRYVIVENVPALLGRGLGRVLGDLSALGYDAEWDCLPASAFGAPHRRDRIWIVAYPGSEGLEGHRSAERDEAEATDAGGDGRSKSMADAASAGKGEVLRQGRRLPLEPRGSDWGSRRYWPVEPNVGRVANGVAFILDKP